MLSTVVSLALAPGFAAAMLPAPTVSPVPLAPPAHGGHLHLVADSVVGIVVGVALVAVYLAALRWLSDDPVGVEDSDE